VAGIAAFGGGTLRDVLLDRRPFFWVEHAGWLWVLLAICVVSMAWMKARRVVLTSRCGPMARCARSRSFQRERHRARSCSRHAVNRRGADGCGHRRVRRRPARVICNEIPRAFADHRPYAICAFARGWALVGAHVIGLPQGAGVLAGALVAAGLRGAAFLVDFRLPAWKMGREIDE
jgi:uncharacterized membrane protein YeiH